MPQRENTAAQNTASRTRAGTARGGRSLHITRGDASGLCLQCSRQIHNAFLQPHVCALEIRLFLRKPLHFRRQLVQNTLRKRKGYRERCNSTHTRRQLAGCWRNERDIGLTMMSMDVGPVRLESKGKR